MGKKLISEDAWTAAVGALSRTTDYSNWKWSDFAKAAGVPFAVTVELPGGTDAS